jgi:hypothetical protein
MSLGTKSDGQAQGSEPLQICPGELQAIPQPPQCAELSDVSTQSAPHIVSAQTSSPAASGPAGPESPPMFDPSLSSLQAMQNANAKIAST